MSRIIFLITVFLPFLSYAQGLINQEPLPSQVAYHCGELFFSPQGSAESTNYGLMISKSDNTNDPLYYSITSWMLIPGQEPAIQQMDLQIDPDTHEATIGDKGSSYSGTAKFIGKFGKWEEVIIRTNHVVNEKNMIVVAHEINHGDYWTFEQKAYWEEETEKSLIGTYNAILYCINNDVVKTFLPQG